MYNFIIKRKYHMKNIKKILCGVIIASCFLLIFVKANNNTIYEANAYTPQVYVSEDGVNADIDEDILEGIVVEKLDKYIKVDSIDKQSPGLMEAVYPDGFDALNIAPRDKIRVYYTGGILESWPAQINKTVRIEKLE